MTERFDLKEKFYISCGNDRSWQGYTSPNKKHFYRSDLNWITWDAIVPWSPLCGSPESCAWCTLAGDLNNLGKVQQPAFLKVKNGPVICSCLANKGYVFFEIIADVTSGATENFSRRGWCCAASRRGLWGQIGKHISWCKTGIDNEHFLG